MPVARPICLAAVILLALWSAAPAAEPPPVAAGRYGSGDVYLYVHPGRGTVAFHFRLPCFDPFGNLVGTSGDRPVRGELLGRKIGAKVSADAIHTTATGITVWGLHGTFTHRAEFRGRVEFEVGGSGAVAGRPQCLQSTRIRLRHGVPGYVRSP